MDISDDYKGMILRLLGNNMPEDEIMRIFHLNEDDLHYIKTEEVRNEDDDEQTPQL